MGGIVKRSLAMAAWHVHNTIAKAFGLDAATRSCCVHRPTISRHLYHIGRL
jgi:hypothetical protein